MNNRDQMHSYQNVTLELMHKPQKPPKNKGAGTDLVEREMKYDQSNFHQTQDQDNSKNHVMMVNMTS
jgi:hypothetical protein